MAIALNGWANTPRREKAPIGTERRTAFSTAPAPKTEEVATSRTLGLPAPNSKCERLAKHDCPGQRRKGCDGVKLG